MLLSKYAYIKIAPVNSKYWKGLGYDINSTGGRAGKNTGQRIKVSVSHLTSGSNINVSCRCNSCGKKYIQRYSRNKEMCESCRRSLMMKNNNYGTNNRLHDIPKKEDLLEFINKGKQFVATYYGVSIQTVNGWLAKYNIDIEKYCGTIKKVPDDFIENSSIMTLTELKNYYNTSYRVIQKWLDEKDIILNGLTYKKEIPPKNELIELNEKFNTKELASIYDTSPAVIIKWFRNYEVGLKKHNAGTSKAEQELIETINKNGGNFISRKGILENKYLELDGYDDTHNVAIEYCGLFWHSSAMQFDKKKHYEKWRQCSEKNIKLVTIFENEWSEKKEIVKSIIFNKINKSKNRIFARKCEIQEISSKEARLFHENNHLSGYVNSSINIGLFYENKLVSVMSFRKSRYDKSVDYEISRFSSILYTNVIGGGSKLLKYFEKKFKPRSLLSYSDLRIGKGNCYLNMGFEYCGITPPNYFYFHKTNKNKLYSRVAFQKHKLKEKLDIYNENLTEIENMKNSEYFQIYDCGNIKYMKIYD